MSGVFVCVVGPSGAGKDTLLDGARKALAGNGLFTFPRRIVTRQASAAEDHDTISFDDFQAIAAQGRFSLSWQAHGLCYALPGSVRDDLRAGRVATCNLSRQAIAEARQRFAGVRTVLITAPADVLESRLAARGREDAGTVTLRRSRETAIPAIAADLTISNVGPVERHVETLVDYLLGIAEDREAWPLGFSAP